MPGPDSASPLANKFASKDTASLETAAASAPVPGEHPGKHIMLRASAARLAILRTLTMVRTPSLFERSELLFEPAVRELSRPSNRTGLSERE
jgi:hypothetical protein